MDFLGEGFREAWRLLVERDADVFHALWVSLLCSVVAVVGAGLVALPYGATLGLLRPRTHRAQVFVLRVLLSVPTVVIGLVLYALLTRRGLLGDLRLMHTQAAIAIGQALLAFPLLAVHVHGATDGLDRIVLDEARTLGVGRVRTIRLGLGEIRPSLAAAYLTAFGRCVTELGIAVIVGGGIKMETRTLPASIQLEISRGEFGRALAPALLLLVVAAAATLLAHRLSRESMP
jgi:tungstate transport system permease protein